MEPNVPLDIDSHMPEPLRMEGLSRAYVDAIAARAGVNVFTPKTDLGIDTAFSKVAKRIEGRRTDTPSRLVPFQIKASTRWEIRGNQIVYDLEVKTYNDLVFSNCILILVYLPPNAEEWLIQDENRLQLSKCGYYWRPLDRTETTNAETKRIFVPRGQIFTVDALLGLVNERP